MVANCGGQCRFSRRTSASCGEGKSRLPAGGKACRWGGGRLPTIPLRAAGELWQMAAGKRGEVVRMVAIESDFRQAAAMPGGPQGGGAARSYSVADAAQAIGVPERTLRDWIRAGKVATLEPAPSQRGTRIPESAVLELRETLAADAGCELGRAVGWGSGESRQEAAADDGELPQVSAEEGIQLAQSANGGGEEQRVAAENGDAGALSEMSTAALEARLEGAQLAAKLHAQRYRETRTQSVDERERLLQMVERERTESREALARVTEEVEFLREQLQARTDAERELRLLLARTTQTMEQLAEKPALVANTQSPKQRVRWWMPWRRR